MEQAEIRKRLGEIGPVYAKTRINPYFVRSKEEMEVCVEYCELIGKLEWDEHGYEPWIGSMNVWR